MASSIIRRGFFSWAAPAGGVDTQVPYPVSATESGTSVAIVFNEAMRTGPAVGQFACTVDGVARGINAASVSGSTLTLTLASAVTPGQAVVVTYTPSATQSERLADASRGNEVGAGVLVSGTAT